MGSALPYMTSAGTLPKILTKVIEAAVPESFNGDFLGTKLGFPGGNQQTFISWAKKCGFLNSDGTPTQLYKNFRNPAIRKTAMAEALKIGYSELYQRNEYAHDLQKKEFIQLICEITGLPHDNRMVDYVYRTFTNAKEFADFDAAPPSGESTPPRELPAETAQTPALQHKGIGLGLNYTINLVLPKTDDPAIYDAIFKSLKENLFHG